MKIIALIQLYSVQIALLLGAINTFIASRPDVPWWFVLAVNLVGVTVGMIVRDIPQPVVAAKLQALRHA